MNLRLVLDMQFDLNGVDPEDLRVAADQAIQREMGNGAFTAGTEAEITTWDVTIQESAKPFPDYKSLFEQAIFHLRCVSGSRNSFSMEMRERMFDPDLPRLELRTEGVNKMHMDAVEFLKQYDI